MWQALDVRRSRQQMPELSASKMPLEVLERGSGCPGRGLDDRKRGQETQEAIRSCRCTVIWSEVMSHLPYNSCPILPHLWW
jgi:hypothetical protein